MKPGLCMGTTTASRRLRPALFPDRPGRFPNGELCWLPWLHVMHPLFDPDAIQSVKAPEFAEAYDEHCTAGMALNRADAVARFLLEQETGLAKMILLRGVREGRIEIDFKSGPALIVEFPVDLYPTLGIWWNNGGYPDENDLRRRECAFEPIPGSSSDLAQSARHGSCPVTAPGKETAWRVVWRVTE